MYIFILFLSLFLPSSCSSLQSTTSPPPAPPPSSLSSSLPSAPPLPPFHASPLLPPRLLASSPLGSSPLSSRFCPFTCLLSPPSSHCSPLTSLLSLPPPAPPPRVFPFPSSLYFSPSAASLSSQLAWLPILQWPPRKHSQSRVNFKCRSAHTNHITWQLARQSFGGEDANNARTRDRGCG